MSISDGRLLLPAAVVAATFWLFACDGGGGGPARDELAALIRTEGGELEARVDAVDRVEAPATQDVIDALLLVMKDRSQQAFITVRDDSALGFHVEESPFGGPDLRAELRWAAIAALERIGAKQALPDLISAVHDRHPVVRNHAAAALWKLGHPLGLEILLKGLEGKALENESANRLLKELTGEDFGFNTDSGWINKKKAIDRWRDHLRKDIERGPRPPRLGEDGELDRRVRFLVAVLGQHQFLFMEQARRALSQMDGLTVEHLRDAARDETLWGNQQLRAYSVQVLQSIDSDGSRALLRDLLDDPDGSVRARAADACGELGDTAAAARLTALLDDDDESVVIAAARALGRLGDAGPGEKLAALFRAEDSSLRLKLTAAAALVRLGRVSEGAGAYLLSRLRDADVGERVEIIDFLKDWHGDALGFDDQRPGSEQPEVLAAWKKVLGP